MKNINKFLIGAAGCLMLTSCYDLEQLPADSVVVDYNNATQAHQALIGAYQTLNNACVYNGWYSIESMSDLGWSNNGWWPAYDHYDMGVGTANTYNGGVRDTWTNHYEGISRCNDVIRSLKTSTLEESTKIQYIAEASFLRALYYNNLLNFFGGVPIYDDTFEGSASDMLKARSSADDVRNFIIEDLTYAIEHLPKTGESVGTASQGAAYALRGKVYLYNQEYDKAKADLEQVVNGGYGYALNGSYADLFLPSGYENGADDCSEIIFAVEHMGGVSTAYGMHIQFLGHRGSYGGSINTNVASKELVDMYECIDGKPYNRDDFFAGISDDDLYLCDFDENGQYVVTYPSQVDMLKAMYAKRDPRMDATVILPYTMYKGWVNNEKADLEMVIARDGYHSYEGCGYVRNAYNQNTYLWRKFIPEYDLGGQITDRGNSPVNWPIIRYADVLLMLAECYNQSSTPDQTKAVSYINQVRSRAGIAALNSGPSWLVATTQSDVFKRIQQERAVEFALEGIRYFDLKRWGILVEKTNGLIQSDILGNRVGTVKNISDKYNLWPIPGSEIDLNSSLTQNTGW